MFQTSLSVWDDPVLIWFCSSSVVVTTSSSQPCPDTPSAFVFFFPAAACLCFTYSVSVFLSFPPCLLSLSLFLFSPHASVRCSMVEDPSPVSGNKAPLVGSPSGQGPVPLSVICWYRVQSLSFSESCRSLEVKAPGR